MWSCLRCVGVATTTGYWENVFFRTDSWTADCAGVPTMTDKGTQYPLSALPLLPICSSLAQIFPLGCTFTIRINGLGFTEF